MNITISQINNGFIVAVAAQTMQGPQQSATYVKDTDGVKAEVAEAMDALKIHMENQPPQIVPGSPEDR